MTLNSKHSVAIGRAFFWSGLACFVVVGLALVLQHAFNIKPCPWCTFQRLFFLVAGLLLLIAARLVMGHHPKLKAGVVFALLAGLCSAGGLWAALHMQFVAAAQDSCDLTFADRVMMATHLDKWLPWLFKANASCSEGNVALLGVPFAVWAAVAFGLLLVVCILGALRLIRR